MDLGEQIKKYRKEAGLTQKELAEILDVATGTIQQYELGKRQPRLEMINRIAGALGIGVRRLYPDFTLEEWKQTETYKDLQLKRKLDPEETSLNYYFNMLNDDGRNEAIKRVSELAEIERYRREDLTKKDLEELKKYTEPDNK